VKDVSRFFSKEVIYLSRIRGVNADIETIDYYDFFKNKDDQKC